MQYIAYSRHDYTPDLCQSCQQQSTQQAGVQTLVQIPIQPLYRTYAIGSNTNIAIVIRPCVNVLVLQTLHMTANFTEDVTRIRDLLHTAYAIAYCVRCAIQRHLEAAQPNC
jgi:hypothetical protein